MADLPFWVHPDASTEVLTIHDHYFDVARSLAEDFQAELERSRSVIARSPDTWPEYLHGDSTVSDETLSLLCRLSRFDITNRDHCDFP